MGKIDLSVKINNRGLTEDEQQFISLWLKFLELVLETGSINIFIEEMKIMVSNLKQYMENIKGG